MAQNSMLISPDFSKDCKGCFKHIRSFARQQGFYTGKHRNSRTSKGGFISMLGDSFAKVIPSSILGDESSSWGITKSKSDLLLFSKDCKGCSKLKVLHNNR